MICTIQTQWHSLVTLFISSLPVWNLVFVYPCVSSFPLLAWCIECKIWPESSTYKAGCISTNIFYNSASILSRVSQMIIMSGLHDKNRILSVCLFKYTPMHLYLSLDDLSFFCCTSESESFLNRLGFCAVSVLSCQKNARHLIAPYHSLISHHWCSNSVGMHQFHHIDPIITKSRVILYPTSFNFVYRTIANAECVTGRCNMGYKNPQNKTYLLLICTWFTFIWVIPAEDSLLNTF